MAKSSVFNGKKNSLEHSKRHAADEFALVQKPESTPKRRHSEQARGYDSMFDPYPVMTFNSANMPSRVQNRVFDVLTCNFISTEEAAKRCVVIDDDDDRSRMGSDEDVITSASSRGRNWKASRHSRLQDNDSSYSVSGLLKNGSTASVPGRKLFGASVNGPVSTKSGDPSHSETSSCGSMRDSERGRRLTDKTERFFEKSQVNDHDTVSDDTTCTFHVRTAAKADIEQMTSLYNAEVDRGGQTIDTCAIKPGTFRMLYERCHRAGLPMIVAVEGEAASEWQSNASSQWSFSNSDSPNNTANSHKNHAREHAQPSWSSSWPSWPVEEEAKDKVLGFAFAMPLEIAHETPWTVSTARISVRLYALVGPAFRRHGVGLALVDRCLAILSGQFVPRSPGAPHVEYSNTILNVFVDVFVDCENDDHHVWMSAFLASCGFAQVGFLPLSHKTRRGPTSKLISKAMFHHRCRRPQEVRNL